MSQTVQHVALAGREVILVGTAHVSRESIDEVAQAIETEKPDHVCVELDEGRYRSISERSKWQNVDIIKVIREGKAFLMLANLVLSSFQRRMGAGIEVQPGDEMKKSVETAQRLGIPYSFCDREIQVTLRRAWSRSNLWNRSKLLAALAESAFSNEKLSEEEIEALKNKSALDDMMGELANYLPSVKEVLIDERDRYLATMIYRAGGTKTLAVVGAGHMDGIMRWLADLDAGKAATDLSDIDSVPPKGKGGKVAQWIIPGLLVVLFVAGFLKSPALSLNLILKWILFNGGLAALGSALSLAHPLTILVSFVGAPVASMNPFVGIGLFAAITEAFVRKPQVSDFETLNEDVLSFRGFYRNKVTKILLIFFLSSIGGAVGNFISIPYLTSLVI